MAAGKRGVGKTHATVHYFSSTGLGIWDAGYEAGTAHLGWSGMLRGLGGVQNGSGELLIK
jgi:hypothetical protein